MVIAKGYQVHIELSTKSDSLFLVFFFVEITKTLK